MGFKMNPLRVKLSPPIAVTSENMKANIVNYRYKRCDDK